MREAAAEPWTMHLEPRPPDHGHMSSAHSHVVAVLGAVGERPVEWTAAEQRPYTRPAGLGPQYCAVSLLHAGSDQPVDALAHFCGRRSWRDSFTSSNSSLNGGGAPGILTNVGLEQANALGASLRSRYVDPAAQGQADVGRARLLPASWEAARGLVAARSTLVERTVFTVSGLALSLTPNPNPDPDPNPNPNLNPDPSPKPKPNPQPHPSPNTTTLTLTVSFTLTRRAAC